MSKQLQTQGEKLSNRSSPGSGWRKVLELGETLYVLSQSSFTNPLNSSEYSSYPDRGVILAQRDLILQIADEISGGAATLWLPCWLGQETGYLQRKGCDNSLGMAEVSGIFSDTPDNPTAYRVIQTGQTCLQRVKGQQVELSIPLFTPEGLQDRSMVLGVLNVAWPTNYLLRQGKRDLLEALARQAATALQTSRQAAIERWRVEQLTTLVRAGNALTSMLNQDQLLKEVIRLIHEQFGFPFIHIFSVHPGRRKIFFEAGSGSRSQALAEAGFAYDLDDPQGMIPWVARQGETILANDVSLDQRYRPAPFSPEETRAELTIPLKFGSEILGVLDIQSDSLGAFEQHELFLLEALADNIAIAMRNASLYRSEQWRRQVADSLREVAGMLSAEVGLDQVLNATLVELERNLPCDLAAIWFLDEEQDESQSVAGVPALRLAAVRGIDSTWIEPQVGLNLDEILDLNLSLGEAADSPAVEEQALPGWLIDALQAEQPVLRLTEAPQDLIGSFLELPADYSAVAAALRVGEQRLGLLTLIHHTSGRYGSEARAIAAAFASYASVAIQNTRIYESAHEQVWVSTVLLQVAEATQTLDDLYELLSTVVNITPMLVGVQTCAIYLCNEDGVFFPTAAAGMAGEAQAEFERRRFVPGDVPALDHLWVEKHPTIVLRQGEDLRLASLFPAVSARGEAFELLVLVPLLARQEVLGALLIQYSSDPVRNALQSMENFFEERLSILQGIAHQTATAVDNIHLQRSQKEETYVSVALLQVAQAIVSSNDLLETLGAIVRITPILTGVRRVAVYLFDQKGAQLRLVQSYGMPRDVDPFPYGLEEFPLLEAAMARNALVAYPLNPVSDDEWEDVPEVWTYLPAPDQGEVAEYLTGEPRLLLAYPLSVTGVVLGALLVEEPDTNRENEIGAASNLRLRPKRLEITTGISQQAALAVQNDQLKRKMVERERLEQEMQLARQIQRTFLPEQMPDLPGWQVEFWWQSAREVGGDFYDFISLPDGMLGLVIADVADKGISAAMFMILVRALLHASVKESISPASVLTRVNTLLVPDSHDGNFVTLFYAVLDPLRGRLTYANAGHNPPFWVRCRRHAIESLAKTSMALGVLEDIPIEERAVSLEPGDYLILYTDGVTDLLSPEGLLFDSDHLYQNIWDAAFGDNQGPPSAQAMLQAIDAALQAFSRGIPPSDDSTMLILYRQLPA